MYKRHSLQLIRSLSIRHKSIAVSPANASQEVDNQLPFSRARIGNFFQEEPRLGNQFLCDAVLQGYLRRVLPSEVHSKIEPDLIRFGQRVATDIFDLGRECEKNQPKLEHYNAWGERVDEVITSSAWKQQKNIAAEEGLIAIAYERQFKEWSRLYQIAKLYLYSSSSGLYSCPLAMTDGAARITELLGNEKLLNRAYPKLISRDPQTFWTSGQWMTERRGGSDVANGTETVAVEQSDGTYKLYGYKWFTSATDSDIALTLARIVDRNGSTKPGTKGLSMFYLETRDENGKLNNIEVQRLKDKLGTRQLPTAELLLDGTVALRTSPVGRGINSISQMLTLTRIHNSLSSAAAMRRVVSLAKDYCQRRTAFGKLLKDHKLHMKTLAGLEIETRGSLLMSLDIARLLGLEECGMISDEEKELLRILTPLAKLYTAKQAVAVSSEGLECFGGAGYLEDSGLPSILRDAQVLPIWEGTTNVLSMDVLRAIVKTKGQVLLAFKRSVCAKADTGSMSPELSRCSEKLKTSATQIFGFAAQNMDKLELAARDLSYGMARTYIGALLVEQACWDGATQSDIFAAKRWCEKDFLPMVDAHAHEHYTQETSDEEINLVMESFVSPEDKL